MKKETNAKKGIWKKILIIILIILIVFFIWMLRNFIILNRIESISKDKMENSNFYAEIYTYNNGDFSIRKTFNKNDAYLTLLEFQSKNINEERKILLYKNGNDNIGLIKSGDSKIAIENNELVGGKCYVKNGIDGIEGLYKLIFAATSKITSAQINSKDCYLISPCGTNWLMFIDKETGLLVREINGEYITDYNYKFNVVTDEYIKRPDTTGYVIKD